MPALARVLRPALRAGFRKPSGEEAAVSAPNASGYGDSGVAAVLTMAQIDLGDGHEEPRASNMPGPERCKAPTLAVAGRRLRRGWTRGAAGPAPRSRRWRAWARKRGVGELMSCHTTVA